MPENNIDGVAALKDGDLPVASDGKTYTDEQLAELAKKTGDTVEHMKEMLGLFDKKDDNNNADNNVNNNDNNNADALLAGKFKTQDDLNTGIQNLIEKFGAEKAYKMLESNMGKQNQEGDTNDGNKDVLSGDGADKGTNTDNKDALDGDGDSDGEEQTIDFQKYFTEFGENQKLSDESYKELSDAGFSKELVDDYIASKSAQSELYTNNVTSYAGGEEQYNAMVDWGTQNLTDAEKARFNDAVNSGNFEQAKTVVDALKSRYEAKEGTFQRGGITPSNSLNGNAVEGYESVAEMQKDMSDPRYRNGDMKFINQVKAKIKASKIM